MSWQNRQTTQHRIATRQRRSALDMAVSVAPEQVVAARPTAEDERERRGDTLLRDWKPHDLCHLGLNDICRGG